MRWRFMVVLFAFVGVGVLAVAGSGGAVLEIERTLDLPAAVDGETFETATWSKEGTWVAACSRSSGDAVVWNTSDWAVAQHVSLSLASCKDMQFSPNEEFLMVVGDDGSDTKGEYSINTSTWAVTDLAIGGCCRKDSVEFLPNGDYVQIGTRNLGTGISNLSARVVPSFDFHDSNTATMNGDSLFDCDWMDTVRVLCTGSGRIGKAHVPNVQREEFLGSFSDTAISLDLDISTSRILVLSIGEILVLDMDDGSTLATWDSGLSADVESQIEFSASRDVGVVSYHDSAGGVQELRAYLGNNGVLVDSLELPGSDVRGLNFSRSEDRFAVAGSGGVFVVSADTEGAFLEADSTFETDGDVQEVRATTHFLAEDIRVYARDRGLLGFPEGNIHQFNSTLSPLLQDEHCDSQPGQDAPFTGGGLAITSDNFPVTHCTDATIDRPLLKILNPADLSLHSQGSHVVLDSLDSLTNMDAVTGNKVLWVNQTQTVWGQSDIPNVDTVVEERFVIDVSADFDSENVLAVGDGGLIVAEDVGGFTIAESATIDQHTTGELGSLDGKRFAWVAADGDTVEKYQVTGGAFTLNGSYESGVSPHTVELSPDARFLAVIGNQGVELVDADSMEVLNLTAGTPSPSGFDLRSGAFDACNNWMFIGAGDANNGGEVLRFPVHQHTDCGGFGGTNSTGEGGTNEPPEGTSSGDSATGEKSTQTQEGEDFVDDTTVEPVDEQPDPQEPVETTPEGLLGDNTIQGVADGLGVNPTGARITLAGLLIAGLAMGAALAAARSGFSSTGAASLAGAIGGFVISLGLGLIPIWVPVIAGIIALALLVLRGRGG